MASADESTSGLNQARPPSYLQLMEEGLPSYQEAVMMGQEMKQDMASKVVEEEEYCYLPSYVEACRVEEEALEEVKLEGATSLGEVLEENLDEVKVVEVGTEIAILEEAPIGEALDEALEEEDERDALDEVKGSDVENL